MKKFLYYLLLGIIFIFTSIIIFFIIGISFDILNLILQKSIFSWFYKLYGITFKWSLWGFLLVFLFALGLSSEMVLKLKAKLIEKELL